MGAASLGAAQGELAARLAVALEGATLALILD
jgi:hypothetical protein